MNIPLLIDRLNLALSQIELGNIDGAEENLREIIRELQTGTRQGIKAEAFDILNAEEEDQWQ